MQIHKYEVRYKYTAGALGIPCHLATSMVLRDKNLIKMQNAISDANPAKNIKTNPNLMAMSNTVPDTNPNADNRAARDFLASS